jgi:hypothetical protein
LKSLKYRALSGEDLNFSISWSKQYILVKNTEESTIILSKTRAGIYSFRSYQYYLLINDLQKLVPDIWDYKEIKSGKYEFSISDPYKAYAVRKYISDKITKSPIKYSALFNAYHENFQLVVNHGGIVLSCVF